MITALIQMWCDEDKALKQILTRDKGPQQVYLPANGPAPDQYAFLHAARPLTERACSRQEQYYLRAMPFSSPVPNSQQEDGE